VQYGRQMVPLSAEDDAFLSYRPVERRLQLIGFTVAENVPRSTYMEVGVRMWAGNSC
jgi:hypothetical protein